MQGNTSPEENSKRIYPQILSQTRSGRSDAASLSTMTVASRCSWRMLAGGIGGADLFSQTGDGRRAEQVAVEADVFHEGTVGF